MSDKKVDATNAFFQSQAADDTRTLSYLVDDSFPFSPEDVARKAFLAGRRSAKAEIARRARDWPRTRYTRDDHAGDIFRVAEEGWHKGHLDIARLAAELDDPKDPLNELLCCAMPEVPPEDD